MSRNTPQTQFNGRELNLAIGAGDYKQNDGRQRLDHELFFQLFQNQNAAPGTIKIALQGANEIDNNGDGPVFDPGLAEGTTATSITTSLFPFRMQQTNFIKEVIAAGEAFSAAHRITLGKNGVIGVYLSSAENNPIETKVNKADQTTAQAFDTVKEAIDDFDNITPPTEQFDGRTVNKILIGKILIEADAADWVANTNNLSSDPASIFFIPFLPFVTIAEYPLTTQDKTDYIGFTHISEDKPFNYFRSAVIENTSGNVLVDLRDFTFNKNVG